ncbi:hypothetical protein BKA63DRAFT_508444 [Paraphoma chrysanthemicola]|nr:hypothetical protein BKA63DRAFT_508444 [Paraphoma chrysanthemicola]
MVLPNRNCVRAACTKPQRRVPRSSRSKQRVLQKMMYLHDDAGTFVFEQLLSVGMSNQNTLNKTSPAVSESDPVEKPVLLRIPTADGSPKYHDIYELPEEVLYEIVRKCEAAGNYTADKFGGKSFCVRNHLTRQFSGKAPPGQDSARPNQEFGLGGEQAQSADDKCCKDRTPCMHVFQRAEMEFALCLVPFPLKLGGNAEWNELAYWLWEKGTDSCASARLMGSERR